MIKPGRRHAGRVGIALIVTALALGLLAQPATAKPTWLSVSTLSVDGSAAQQPDVTVDSQGNLLAAWTGAAGVQAADRPAGGLWTRSTIEAGVAAEGVKIAVDDAGNALAVWQTTSTSRIRASYRPDGGQWSIPETISDPAVPSFEPKVAMDATGAATAVWYAHEGANYRIRTADRSAAGTWSAPLAVSPAGGAAKSPGVAVSANGMDVLVWSWSDGSHYRIQAVERSGSRSWSAPAFLSAAGADSRTPQVALNSSGYLPRVVWTRDDDVSRVQQAGWNASGWGAPYYVSEAGQNAYQPRLDITGSVTAIAWHSSDGTDERARARLAGSQGWEPSALTISPAGVDVSEVQATVDATGWVTIAWTGLNRASNSYLIQSQRVAPFYSQLPPPEPAQTEVASSSASNLTMAVDGAGDVVAGWQRDGEVKAAVLDNVGPVSTVSAPTATRQTATSFSVTRTADDRWSDVAGITTYVRSAPWNGTFGSPGIWYGQWTTDTATFPGQPGYTYCFTATSRDAVGNSGQYSAERCTATPMDDRTITANSSWYRGTSSSFYEGTFTRARTAGALLTRSGVQARHLALLATKCATCGSVRAYWNGTLIGTFNLAAPSTQHKQLVSLKTFAGVETGTLKLVTTSAKTVYVDGLVARRS